MDLHAAASPWVLRWAECLRLLLPVQARVLDVACGRGRHTRLFEDVGYKVTAVDRDAAALAGLEASEKYVADLELGGWPFGGRQFDLIVVTNYLHRPLFGELLASLAPCGFLLYETFAAGNASVGKPSNPSFLLEPGELLVRCAGLKVIAYEDGYLNEPRPAFVQRLCAVREGQPGMMVRYPLHGRKAPFSPPSVTLIR